MLLLILATAATLAGSGYLFSLWWTLFRYTPLAMRAIPCRGPQKICVVLGSGGHTSEMLRSIRHLPPAHWLGNRPCYVVSVTDTHSAAAAKEQELRLFGRNASLCIIPRAREVGQSYRSSVLSTLKALAASLRVVAAERPDVLLTNGPGVCVPVVGAAILLSALVPWWYARPAIVYMESFTCVQHASLTGRLLAPFLADVVTVSWKTLMPVVARMRLSLARPQPWLFFVGPRDAVPGVGAAHRGPVMDAFDVSLDAPPEPRPHAAKFALVTVGSTQFPDLIKAMATQAVCRTLSKVYGVNCLLLQYGTTDFDLQACDFDFSPASVDSYGSYTESADSSLDTRQTSEVQRLRCGGVTVEAFPYKNRLDSYVRHASLVVTHAGAGTILECLMAHVPTVVVPNRKLMSDHQLELADALAADKYLFSLRPEELATSLPTLNMQSLRRYGGVDDAALARALSLPLLGKNSSKP